MSAPAPHEAEFVPISEQLLLRSERARAGDRWSPVQLGLLLGIVLLAIGLRLWNLEQWSLSAAEAATWRAATSPLAGPGGFLASDDSCQPLCHLLLRWLLDVGALPFHGEGWLRLPFACAGVLTVPLVAVVAERPIGRRAALLAAALLAVHPWHVAQSQSASGEVAALFFAVLGAGMVAAPLDTGRRRGAIGAGCCVLLAAGCDASGWGAGLALALGAQLGHAPPVRRRRLPAVAAAGLLVAAAVLLGSGFASGPARSPFELVAGWVAAGRPSVWLAAAVACLLPLRRDARGAAAWLAIAAAAPLALGLLAGCLGAAVAAADGLLAVVPLCCLAAVAALAWFDKVVEALGGARGWVLPGALAGLCIGADLAVDTGLRAAVHGGGRPDWRGARDAVLRAAGTERLAVIAGRGIDCLTYYLRPNHHRDPSTDAHPGVALAPLGEGLAGAAAPLGPGARFAVLARDELLRCEADPADRAVLQAGRAVAVLPSSAAPDRDTLYVIALGGG